MFDMYNDILLTSPSLINTSSNNAVESVNPNELFITFINRLEGWKTKCKNLN